VWVLKKRYHQMVLISFIQTAHYKSLQMLIIVIIIKFLSTNVQRVAVDNGSL